MSPEILTIISVGIALATAMLAGLNRIDKRIDRLESRLDQRMGALEQHAGLFDQRMGA